MRILCWLMLVAWPAGADTLLAFSGGRLLCIDTRTQKVVRRLETRHNLGNGTLGSKAAYFVTGSPSGIQLFDLATGRFGPHFNFGDLRLTRVVPARDGRTLWVVGQDGTILVLDALSGKEFKRIAVPSQNFDGAMSPDGRWLYVPHRDSGTISVISTETRAVVKSITAQNGAHDIVIAADGRHAFVTNEYSNSVSYLDLLEGKVTATLEAQQNPIPLVRTADGALVVVGNRDSSSLTLIRNLKVQHLPDAALGRRVRNLAISGDGKLYVSGISDKPGDIPPLAVYDTRKPGMPLIAKITMEAEVTSMLSY